MIDLRSPSAHVVVDTGRALYAHAGGCEMCGPATTAMREADDPSEGDYAAYDGLCPDGEAMFVVWRDAKNAWLEETRALRRRQFVTADQLWDDGVSIEVRGQAIMSMPPPAFVAWLALPDEARHRQLLALESTIHPRGGSGQPAGPSSLTGRPTRKDSRPWVARRPQLVLPSTDPELGPEP